MEKLKTLFKYTSSFIMVIFILTSSLCYAGNSSEVPAGYKPKKGTQTPFQIKSEGGTPDILLIQTANPWDSDADTTVLDGLSYSYRVIDMTEVPSTSIDDFQVVLIVNDQIQSFYDNYAVNYDRFEDYVENGGILVFFACDHGWANGNNYTDLPGGVEVGDRYNYTNTIANSNHPIVTQELTKHSAAPLMNSDMYSNYCSHNYFVESTLPAGGRRNFPNR